MRWRYVTMDYVTSAAAFLIFNGVRFKLMNLNRDGTGFLEYLTRPKLIAEEILLPLIMLAIYWLTGYYNRPFGKSRLQEMSNTLTSAIFTTFLIYMTLLINDQMPSRYVNYEMFLLLFAVLFFCTYVGRLLLTQTSINNLKRRRWAFNTVIVGNSTEAIATADRLNRTQAKLGYNILGHLPIPGETPSKKSHKELTPGQFEELCKHNNIDQLILAPDNDASEKMILDVLYEYFPSGLPIKIRPSSMSFLTSGIRIGDIYAEPFIDLASPAMNDSQQNIKRVFDIGISALALLITSPLLLAIAIAVKCTSKGAILYRQERIGYRHKPFKILKFRSMNADAEDNGPQLSIDNDPRITRVGRLLRKYRLDELPQFWNVIKGEMSLVGPRPEREYYIEQIVKKAPHYTLVHQVKPGITSWGMVKFGYASNVDEMVERSNYDLIYLSNMSVAVDFKIMLHTISTVLMGKGK